MSKPSWVKTLTQTIRRLKKPDRPAKVAIVGIGHELCGDDAAGIMIARALQALTAWPASDHLLVIEAGSAPENHTGIIRHFEPDFVLLIDAARMDETPGAVRWLAWPMTTGFQASTHTLPPHLLARYLTTELGCEVALLGIEPANVTVDTPLTPAVQQAVDMIVQTLIKQTAESG